MSLVNQPVSSIFNLILLLPGQTLEVSDVQVRLLLCLLGSRLPDVRSKNLSAGSEDDMSAGVMGLKLHPSRSID